MSPIVSVIIPTYNSVNTVTRAIDSVLAQTFKDLEIIVVDDGSTDNTRERLANYADQIRYIYQENQERSAARNTGIRNVRGEFIAFLDADDYWLPTKLEKQVAVLRTRPELGMVYCRAYAVNEQGDHLYIIGHSLTGEDEATNAFCHLLLGNFIISPTPLISHRCVQKVGLFDETLRQAEDWDYWLRIAKQYPVASLEEPLACYTVTGPSLLQKMAAREAQMADLYVLEKGRNVGICPEENITLAFALAWFRAALLDFGLGQIEEGKRRLEMALKYEPCLFTIREKIVVDSLTNLAVQLCDGQESAEDGEHFLHSVREELTDKTGSNKLLRLALSRFYASRLFQGHWRDDQRVVRASLWPMIRNDPRWLRNRGIWSIALQAFLMRTL